MNEFVYLLRSIPAAAYAAVMAALVTGVITLIAVNITNRANFRRALAQKEIEKSNEYEGIKRERIESLYTLVQEFAFIHRRITAPYILALEGTKLYQELLSLEHEEELSARTSRITMLVDMYCPEIRDDLQVYLKAVNRPRDIFGAYIQAIEKSGHHVDSEALRDDFHKASHAFFEQTERFKARILSNYWAGHNNRLQIDAATPRD